MIFRGASLTLQRGPPQFRVRSGSRFYNIRYIARRLRIKFSGRWCRLRYKSGIWKVKLPRQRRWEPILRKRRKWFARYRGRMRYLPRGFKTFAIKIGRFLKPLRPLGGRGLYTVKIGKKSYRTMKLRYTWRTHFRGKLLPVRRTGNYASLRYKGKWSPKVRIFFPRRKARRGREIIPLAFLERLIHVLSLVALLLILVKEGKPEHRKLLACLSMLNSGLKHATFLSHGRQPEVNCFPI